MRWLKTLLALACLAGAAALNGGCDATTSGVRVEPPSTFPYNPRW